MKRLIKFFKGLGGKELSEVHEYYKTSHPLNYLFRGLHANKDDVEIILKLEELLSQEKIKIVCKSDGMPIKYKNGSYDILCGNQEYYFKVKVGNKSFRVCFLTNSSGSPWFRLKDGNPFSNTKVAKFVYSKAYDMYNRVIEDMKKENKRQQVKQCLHTLNNI